MDRKVAVKGEVGVDRKVAVEGEVGVDRNSDWGG